MNKYRVWLDGAEEGWSGEIEAENANEAALRWARNTDQMGALSIAGAAYKPKISVRNLESSYIFRFEVSGKMSPVYSLRNIDEKFGGSKS